jgi:preprotein translocase subunit SecG
MKKYLSRLARYLLLLMFMIIILLAITFLRSGDGITELKEVFMKSERIRLFLIVVVAYSLIYPVLVFGKKERYINGKFSDNRDGFIKAFAEQNYILTREKETILEFRKKSGFSRIMSLGQDKIEVNYTNNPVIIEGLRKELRRLDGSLDMNLLKQD